MLDRRLLLWAGASAALLLTACSGDDTIECIGDDVLCGTSCVDTMADPRHCGGCDLTCGAGEVCAGGSCGVQCPDGQSVCAGGCFDTTSSTDHCGECGNACAAGEVCAAGSCEASCPSGQVDCAGLCVSTASDEANCGACGTACAAGEVCAGGSCAVSCGGSLVECSGVCKDTAVDRDNCGACGTTCAADEACVNGACEPSCGPGQIDCAGTCTSIVADEANCGACGNACGANELCVSGTCTLTCAGVTPDECAGACTNLLADPTNCGSCGTACGATESCLAGTCASNCGALTDCNGSCTDVNLDPMNCGGCGTTCTATTGASGVCIAGSCTTACTPGRGDCDGDLQALTTNGCEVDLDTSATDCGACGNACTYANATGVCTTGACALGVCDTGFEDCNTTASDGCETEIASDAMNCGACGNVCAGGLACVNGICDTLQDGESCAGPLLLTAGVNTKMWTASNNDYLSTAPSCMPTFTTVDGPDLVMQYTPTFNGFAQFDLDKPTSTRYAMSISDAPCGMATPELACVSEFSANTMGFGIQVTASTDYFVYLIDTASGSGLLPNPIEITVTETDCTNPTPVTVTQLNPTSGSTTASLFASFEVTFSAALDTTTGTITITGNQGTSLGYDLSTGPTQVSFNSAGDVMTVDPGVAFPPGEELTLSWIGLGDQICSAPIAPPVPAYTQNVVVPPCVPGQNGLNAGAVSVIPTGGPSFSEYFMATDTSTSGWVYAGGTTSLYRYRKDGSAVEDLEDPTRLGSLPSSVLGYGGLWYDSALYVIDSATGTTLPVNGRMWRLTNDDGATWAQQDMAQWSTTAPADDFRAMAEYGGRIYMITQEGTSSVDTEIWSIDPKAAVLPDEAVLEGTFPSANSYGCSALAVDASYYYAICGSPSATEPVIRVDRTTLAVTILADKPATGIDFSGTVNSIFGADNDNDGIFDYLYIKGWYERGHYMCDPAGTPYISQHYTFATDGSSNYGSTYDPVNNVIWNIDDSNRDLIKVE